jgi:hypothetical protein
VSLQAYVCEVGYFVDAGSSPSRSPTGGASGSFQLPERVDDGDDDDDDGFKSTTASGRLKDVFLVLQSMSKVRVLRP